jgi:hypothetical protein
MRSPGNQCFNQVAGDKTASPRNANFFTLPVFSHTKLMGMSERLCRRTPASDCEFFEDY